MGNPRRVREKPTICSLLVRSTRDNLGTGIFHGGEDNLVGQNTQPIETDATSRYIVSKMC